MVADFNVFDFFEARAESLAYCQHVFGSQSSTLADLPPILSMPCSKWRFQLLLVHPYSQPHDVTAKCVAYTEICTSATDMRTLRSLPQFFQATKYAIENLGNVGKGLFTIEPIPKIKPDYCYRENQTYL